MADPERVCPICYRRVEEEHALALPECDHKDFHFDCIVDLFTEKVTTRKAVKCPVCGTRVQTIPAPTTVPILRLMTRPLRTVISPVRTVVNPSFKDVWPQVWAKLKAARDAEARLICVDSGKPDAAPDVTRQQLSESGQHTNFRELTSSCRICKRLLGNLHWARLGSCKMKHPFHVLCLASQFVGTLLTADEQQSPDEDQRFDHDHGLECPICHTPVRVLNPCLNKSLLRPINDHLKEVPEETIVYCMNFLFEQPENESLPSPATSSPALSSD